MFKIFGGFPRQFWFQWSGTLINRIGTFIQPFLILYLTTARGLSAQQAGVVVAAWGAGALLGPLIGGWLADHVGRRVTMSGGMLAAAASLAAVGFAQSVPSLLVTALLAGITADIYRPASSALVADIVAAEDRPRAYGLLFWAINLGFAIAATAGGFLASAGYGWLFAIDAATCAVFAGIIWVGVPLDTRPQRTPGVRTVGYLTALRDRSLLLLLGLVLLYSTVYDQAYVTLPLAVHDAELATAVYGSVIAVNGIVIVIIQPFIGAWLAKFNRFVVMAVASLIIGLGFASTGIADSPVEFGATVVLWTLGEVAMAGIGQAMVADLAPENARGRYQGMFTLSWTASGLIGPLIGTTLYTAGPHILWWGCLIAGIVLSAGYLLLGRVVSAARQPEPASL